MFQCQHKRVKAKSEATYCVCLFWSNYREDDELGVNIIYRKKKLLRKCSKCTKKCGFPVCEKKKNCDFVIQYSQTLILIEDSKVWTYAF